MTDALVVADIHANWPALEAVLDDAPATDLLLCAGDVCGLLGWNSRVVDVLRERADSVVFGNHDARVRPDFPYAPSFQGARDEHWLTTNQLDGDQVQWLSNLPERIETDRYILAHSRPVFRRDPGYPVHGYAQGDRGVPPKDVTRYGSFIDGKTAILGHTHEQHAVNVDKFEGQAGLVVNPGSVGVPWHSDAEYAVVDLDQQTYSLRAAEFDSGRIEDRLDSIGEPVAKYTT